MAEFTFHGVFRAVEYLMGLHAQCSLDEVTSAELTRLVPALILFVVLDVQEGIDTTVWIVFAFDLCRFVHANILLLL